METCERNQTHARAKDWCLCVFQMPCLLIRGHYNNGCIMCICSLCLCVFFLYSCATSTSFPMILSGLCRCSVQQECSSGVAYSWISMGEGPQQCPFMTFTPAEFSHMSDITVILTFSYCKNSLDSQNFHKLKDLLLLHIN